MRIGTTVPESGIDLDAVCSVSVCVGESEIERLGRSVKLEEEEKDSE